MTRRLAVTALLVVACIPHVARADSHEIGPDAAGWWQVGAVATVTAAGLADGEVLVDGFGSDEASRHAVAALSFRLDEGSTGGAVSIPVTSQMASGASVTVCTVTAAFAPAYGGPADRVPEHDCSRPAVGVVDDTGSLVIEGAGSLERGGYVRLLLISNGPPRIVLDGTRAALTTAASPSGAQPATEGASPSTSAEQPGRAGVEPSPAPAPGAPEPGIAAPARPSQPLASATAAPGAPALSRFTPRADDSAARLKTAIVVAGALGLFTALRRDSSRLRPRTVPWRRS